MSEMVRSVPRKPLRRVAAASAVCVALLVAMAIPASAHASFSSYSANGYLPNPNGGIGDVAVTTAAHTAPYAANTAVTMVVRAKAEADPTWDPTIWSNVEVQVNVPTGWTNPTCGTANVQINDVTTNSTNQPGAVAAGWNCEILRSEGHDIVRFWGAALAPGALEADCAAFFSFGITTPKPLTQTTYSGETASAEGFIVDQTYASGNNSHWYPNANYVGSVPPGTERNELASGLVRTVAAYAAPVVPVDTTVPATPVTPSFTG